MFRLVALASASFATLLMPVTAFAKATVEHAGSDQATVLHGTLTQMATAACALSFVAVLAVALTSRKARGSGDSTPILSFHLKPTHLLPALIQLVIYAYWALYWRDLAGLLPMIGWQLVWAFALDAILRLWRTGRWQVRVGPVPIVLSANLVALFAPASWPLVLAMISIAILSRDFIRYRGRHIFNPSAFGVSLIGLLNLAWPTLGYGDRAHEFDLPPNMTEVSVLLALVVQLRLPVVLATLGAALSLELLQNLGLHVLSPAWAPVTLILLLFLTDPATIPRSAAGRLLFGAFAGLLMGLIGHTLETLTWSDFYAKALAVPLANLATPALDRVGRQLQASIPRLRRLLSPRANRLHVVLWLSFIGLSLSGPNKAERMRPGRNTLHLENKTPFLVVQQGRVVCADNPLYCQPLRFDLEAACWWRQWTGSSDADRCPGYAP
ncbi:MAG: hypothetical protein KC502_01825 [Myxococcales bacterium]|nr:hypothetical protein [Myxococcales bacterium]